MNGKTTKHSTVIAAYRAAAAGRRSTSVLNSMPSGMPEGVKAVGGVVTVTQAGNAKPVSALGGRTKVLGRSKFSIPELKRSSR
jgi:hypothetical protein